MDDGSNTPALSGRSTSSETDMSEDPAGPAAREPSSGCLESASWRAWYAGRRWGKPPTPPGRRSHRMVGLGSSHTGVIKEAAMLGMVGPETLLIVVALAALLMGGKKIPEMA